MYAVGVILWQCWFRAAPYAGLATAEVIVHVRRGRRPPLAEPPPPPGEVALPRALQRLLEHCWQQAPRRRPTAAAALATFEVEIAPEIEAAFDAAEDAARGFGPGESLGAALARGGGGGGAPKLISSALLELEPTRDGVDGAALSVLCVPATYFGVPVELRAVPPNDQRQFTREVGPNHLPAAAAVSHDKTRAARPFLFLGSS